MGELKFPADFFQIPSPTGDRLDWNALIAIQNQAIRLALTISRTTWLGWNMTTERKFAAFNKGKSITTGKANLPSFRMKEVPDGGFCLSSFLILSPENNPKEVLMGHLNPSAPWDHIGALDEGKGPDAQQGLDASLVAPDYSGVAARSCNANSERTA